MRPRYKKGKAVNLEGAALDALEWLDVFIKLGNMGKKPSDRLWRESMKRLQGARNTLVMFLPDQRPLKVRTKVKGRSVTHRRRKERVTAVKGDVDDDLSEANGHSWCVEVGFFDGEGMAA